MVYFRTAVKEIDCPQCVHVDPAVGDAVLVTNLVAPNTRNAESRSELVGTDAVPTYAEGEVDAFRLLVHESGKVVKSLSVSRQVEDGVVRSLAARDEIVASYDDMAEGLHFDDKDIACASGTQRIYFMDAETRSNLLQFFLCGCPVGIEMGRTVVRAGDGFRLDGDPLHVAAVTFAI